MKRKNGGYIGLLAILVIALIISYLGFAKYAGNDQEKESYIEQNLNAVESAKDAKSIIESKNNIQIE